MVELAIAKAITAGLREAMRKDDKVLVFGEDVAQLGGVFRVTEGLLAEFGKDRIFDSPIAESGIIGTAIGLAMRGYRPVTEIQFDGFIFPAFDQITSQLARLQNRSEGFTTMPVVIRVPYGGGIGAVEHHSESPRGLLCSHPRPARNQPEHTKRRLLDDSAGHRVDRPGAVLRAKASLLAKGHGQPRRCSRRHAPGSRGGCR